MVLIANSNTSAITPKPPFSPYGYLRLVAVLAPMFLMSLFVDYYMVYKGIGAGISLVLFGDPILTPAWHWFNHNYPTWMQQLEPKKYVHALAPPVVVKLTKA